MSSSKFKFGIVILLVGAFVALPFYNIQAQLGIPTTTIEATYSPLLVAAGSTATATGTAATTLAAMAAEQITQTGIQTATQISIGDPVTAATAISTARAGVLATCQPIIAAYDTYSAAIAVTDANGAGVLSVLGGDAVEATKLAVQIDKATAAKICIDGYLAALGAITGSIAIQDAVAREEDKYGKIKASLETVTKELTARQNASVKDIAKAFMVKLILNLNKKLTTELVNKMVEKYKISDYLAYGDALASQVYSMKYINENFKGDARTQMMVRSLLQSDKLPGKIQTAKAFADSKAQEYVGQACDVKNTNADPNDEMRYINCLAGLGSKDASSDYHMSQAQDLTNAASQAGKQSAAQEVSQSKGFAPPRNCEGSLSMQQEIDSQFDKAAYESRIANAVLAKSNQELAAKRITQAEHDKAQAAADQATANLQALKDQTQNPIVDICDAIDSPASFVSETIGDFLKQHLDQASQLKSDNLPFYANFLADVATNFLGNILTGGKSKSQIFKEAGSAALTGGIAALSGSLTQNQVPGSIGNAPVGIGGDTVVGSIKIYAVSASAPTVATTSLVPGQTYTMVIDYAEISNQKPYRANVQGQGGLIKQIDITPPQNAAGKLQFTFTAGSSQFSVIVAFFVAATGNESEKLLGPYPAQDFTIGTVKGASVLLPRGPALTFR